MVDVTRLMRPTPVIGMVRVVLLMRRSGVKIWIELRVATVPFSHCW